MLKREFEKYKALSVHISRMAKTGDAKHKWGEFLDDLDLALKMASSRKPEPVSLSGKVHHQAVGIFGKYYTSAKQRKYVWGEVDAKNLKTLLKRIETMLKQSGKTVTEDMLLEKFKSFLAKINDVFVLENLSVSLVLKNFNVIVSKMNKPVVKDAKVVLNRTNRIENEARAAEDLIRSLTNKL